MITSWIGVDPAEGTVGRIQIPSTAPPSGWTPTGEMFATSPFWGDEKIWLSPAQPRSSAVDQKGRAWIAARIREATNSPLSAKRARTISSRSTFRWTVQAASKWPSMTQRRSRSVKSTLAFPPITISSQTMPAIRFSSVKLTPWAGLAAQSMTRVTATRHPRVGGLSYLTRTATARSPSPGPSRMIQSIPKKITGFTFRVTQLRSAPWITVRGARESARPRGCWCISR